MAELISMTYEQARAEHFKTLKDEAKHKMNYWATRVCRSRPNDLNDPAHIKASEYGAEYSYYNDALEALENQPKWISVEDELPPVGERVLALNGHSVFESFIDCQDVWHRSPTCYELKGNVTHWMPLPSTEGLE